MFPNAGNKLDLDSARAVLVEEGEACATQHGCPFVEISAKMGTGVPGIFMSLARHIFVARRQQASLRASTEGDAIAVASVGRGTPKSTLLPPKQKSISEKSRCILL